MVPLNRNSLGADRVVGVFPKPIFTTSGTKPFLLLSSFFKSHQFQINNPPLLFLNPNPKNYINKTPFIITHKSKTKINLNSTALISLSLPQAHPQSSPPAMTLQLQAPSFAATISSLASPLNRSTRRFVIRAQGSEFNCV